MTGMQLKLRRIAARVQQRDVARQMGLTRATVHKYEGNGYWPSAYFGAIA